LCGFWQMVGVGYVGTGSLLDENLRKLLGCIRAIAKRLLEELRTDFFVPGEIEKLLSARIQIRLDSV